MWLTIEIHGLNRHDTKLISNMRDLRVCRSVIVRNSVLYATVSSGDDREGGVFVPETVEYREE